MEAAIVSESGAAGTSDEEAMARLAAGDGGALGLLFDRHKLPLFGFLWRLVGERALAEDLLSETFLRLYEARGRFRHGAAFRPWVLTIARNLAIAELRRRQRRGLTRMEEAGTGAWHDDLERDELQRRVRFALAELPEEQRAAVILKEYQGLGYREIAAVLGCTEEAARARTYRARLALRELLRGYVEDA